MNYNMVCMIPARAGSKRLPAKNTLALRGKPMIAYSIEVALKSSLFSEVYVCTEDAAIADVARSFGATVPCLVPHELCGDLVPSHMPCQQIVRELAGQGRHFETMVCLQPTSPLRSVEDLRAAVATFTEEKRDFLVSVTPIDPHYFHWAVACDEQKVWGMFFGQKYMVERPLLPGVFRPNGSIKIGRLDCLRTHGHFFGSNLGVIQTPEERSIHVATKFDFDLCEFLLRGDKP